MAFTRESFLAKSALPREYVEIPGMGDGVWVWGLTGKERDTFEASMTVQRGKKRETNLANIRARLLVLVLRDADGSRLFTDSEADKVGDLPASILDPLFDVARRLSGMTEADVDELGKASEQSAPAGS